MRPWAIDKLGVSSRQELTALILDQVLATT
jgi:hypothetical protein